MKKTILKKGLLLICILILSMAFESTYATQPTRFHGHHGRTRPQKPVGAPIDGGLLTILGAAGVGYIFMRKKKLNQ